MKRTSIFLALLCLFLALFSFACVSQGGQLPYPKFKAFDASGKPMAYGKLYLYKPGTLTAKAAYQDSQLSTPLPNPVVLDQKGEAMIFLKGCYKISLTDSTGASIWTKDNECGYGLDATSAIDATQYADLNSAVAAIGSTVTTLVIGQTIPLTAALVVPSTLNIEVKRGGLIDKAGYNLTINGQLIAGKYPVFTGAGTVTFGSVSGSTLYPEWFGASGSSTSGDFKNLTIKNNASFPNTKLDVSADWARLYNGTSTIEIGPISLTIDMTGSLLANTWYTLRLSWDGTNLTGTAMSVAPAPGSNFLLVIGAARTDGGNNFLKFRQQDKFVLYNTSYRISTGGTAQSWTDQNLSAYVPPISVRAWLAGETYGGGSPQTLRVRPKGSATVGLLLVTSSVPGGAATSYALCDTDQSQILQLYAPNDLNWNFDVAGYILNL